MSKQPQQLALATMDPHELCRCKHPRYMHDIFSVNGVCGKLTCPCSGFVAKVKADK